MSARTDKILAENKAQKISYTRNPVLDTTELVRRWAEVRDSEIAACLTELASIRSYTNPQASGGSGLETFPGLWRVVSNQDGRLREDQEPKQGIFQTLRLGLATTPEWDSAMFYSGESLMSNDESVSDLADSSSAETNEVYRTIRFPNIDPLSVDTIVATLTAQETFTDPVVGGISLSGAWSNLGASHRETEDGSHVIDIVLARSQYTVNAYTAQGTYKQEGVHYLWNVPKPNVQGLLDAWASLHPVGATSRVSYSTNQKTADVVLSVRAFFQTVALPNITLEESCEYIETADYYFGLLKDDALALATPEHAVGITYSKRISDNGDGSYDVIITARARQYQSTGEFVSQQDAGRSATRLVESGVGVEGHENPDGTIAELTEGQSGQQSIEVQNDCTKRVVTEIETVVNQTQTVDNVTASVNTSVVRDSALDSAAANALTVPPVPAAGEARTVDRAPHPKYKDVYEVTQTTETVVNQTQRVSDKAAGVETVVVRDSAMDKAAADALGDAPVPLPGESRTLDKAPHPKFKDVFEVRQTTETVIDQVRELTDVTAAVTTDVTQHTAMDLANKELLDAGPLVNEREARSIDITPHPKFKDVFEVRQTTETVANQTSTLRDVNAGVTTERQSDTAMSLLDKAALEAGPAAAEGEARQLSITPHPKFKDVFEVTQTTETVVNQTAQVSDVTASVTSIRTSDTALSQAAKDALDSPPAPSEGQAKTLSVTPHPKFKDVYEVTQITETVTNQQHTLDSVEAAVTTAQVVNTATASAPVTPPSLDVGQAKTIRVTPDAKFEGVFRTEETTETVTSQQLRTSDVRADRTTEVIIDTATTTIPTTPPVPADGESKSVRVIPDPKFSGVSRVEQVTAAAQALEKDTTWTDADGVHRRYYGKYLTAAAVEVLLAGITPSAKVVVSCEPDDEFKNLFNVRLNQDPDNYSGQTSSGNAWSVGTTFWEFTNHRTNQKFLVTILYTDDLDEAGIFCRTPTEPKAMYTIVGEDSGHKTDVIAEVRGRVVAKRVELIKS